MKIQGYKGLYVLTETKGGKMSVLASSWDREDIEKTANGLRTAAKEKGE